MDNNGEQSGQITVDKMTSDLRLTVSLVPWGCTTVSPVTGLNAPHLYMPWCWAETETIWRFPDGRTKYSPDKRRKESSATRQCVTYTMSRWTTVGDICWMNVSINIRLIHGCRSNNNAALSPTSGGFFCLPGGSVNAVRHTCSLIIVNQSFH